jgi:hypothetical protein
MVEDAVRKMNVKGKEVNREEWYGCSNIGGSGSSGIDGGGGSSK